MENESFFSYVLAIILGAVVALIGVALLLSVPVTIYFAFFH